MDSRLALFEPVDVMQFRDARPFDAGVDPMARSMTMPSPATISGAVVSAFGKKVRRIRGPFLASWSTPDDVTLHFPAPCDLVLSDVNGTSRLDWSAASTATADINVAGPIGDGDAYDTTITAVALSEYLAGNPRKALRELANPAHSAAVQVSRERRVGLTIAQNGSAEDSMLYAGEFVRTRPGPNTTSHRHVGFAAFFEADQSKPERFVRLGGEGGQAAVFVASKTAEDLLPKLPDHVERTELLVYLATPALFAKGWRPPLAESVEIVGACMQGPEPVSWGIRQAWSIGASVPAGTLYRLKFNTANDAAEFANRTHGRCLAQHNDDLKHRGFGLSFIGVLP